jgi:hypothetical protein
MALKDGHASVVEGLVSDFTPMPVTGHASESFCVERHCFYYSDFDSSIGFHNAASRGGPIKQDLRLRVSFLGNTILRLEVAPGSAQPPNTSWSGRVKGKVPSSNAGARAAQLNR